jgi:hypothetical protein
MNRHNLGTATRTRNGNLEIPVVVTFIRIEDESPSTWTFSSWRAAENYFAVVSAEVLEINGEKV